LDFAVGDGALRVLPNRKVRQLGWQESNLPNPLLLVSAHTAETVHLSYSPGFDRTETGAIDVGKIQEESSVPHS
jgi:hypothetical protein